MLNLENFKKRYTDFMDVSEEESEAICESVFELLSKIVVEEKKDIKIHDFGVFLHKKRREKEVKHPKTGETLVIPGKSVVIFKGFDEDEVESEKTRTYNS